MLSLTAALSAAVLQDESTAYLEITVAVERGGGLARGWLGGGAVRVADLR